MLDVSKNILREDVCPRCFSTNTEIKEEYFCMICKNCGMTYKYL